MNTYEIVVTFLEPREGSFKVEAPSKEEAAKIAEKLIANRNSGEILFIKETANNG